MKQISIGVLGVMLGAACGGRPRAPAESSTLASPPPSSAGARSWDGSFVHAAPGSALAVAGPVLKAGDPRGGAGPLASISSRCLWIGFGIPYLHDADPMLMNLARVEDAFTATWTEGEAVRQNACAEVFGARWRLPTSEEARSVLGRKDPSVGWLSVLFQDVPGRAGVLRRVTDRCRPDDASCRPFVRVEPDLAGNGNLYCVGPARELPSAEPSATEISGCVRRLGALLSGSERELPFGLVDERALDVVIAARRACSSPAGHAPLVARLRAEAGASTLVRRSQEIGRALVSAEHHLAALIEAEIAVEQAPPADCDGFPELYRRKCAGSAQRDDCLGFQAQFAAHCLGRNPVTELRARGGELARKIAELRSSVRRAETLRAAAARAAKCAASPEVSLSIGEILGRTSRGEEPFRYCSCPLEDLQCGLAALGDASHCPDLALPRTGAR